MGNWFNWIIAIGLFYEIIFGDRSSNNFILSIILSFMLSTIYLLIFLRINTEGTWISGRGTGYYVQPLDQSIYYLKPVAIMLGIILYKNVGILVGAEIAIRHIVDVLFGYLVKD